MRRCIHEHEFKGAFGTFFQGDIGNLIYGKYFHFDFLCHRYPFGGDFGGDGGGKYCAE